MNIGAVIDPTQNDELPSDAEVRSIATLAFEQKEAEGEVLAATEALERALTRYRRISDIDLPAAMRAGGTQAFTTDGGLPIKLVTQYDATNLVDPAGLKWVDENGGSSLIKTAILVEMDRGDIEAAREIFAELRQSRHANRFKTLKLTELVLWNTLAKFVRELIDQRKDPPLDVLNVHRRTYAVVGDRPKSVELKGFTKR